MAENADEKEKILDNNHTLTLAQLEVGESGRILALATSNRDKAGKLLALGLYPGLEVRLLQKFPSPVIQVGHTQFAIDMETARQIEVVRDVKEGRRHRHRHRHRFCFWRSLLNS